MITNGDCTIYNRHYNPATRLDEWRRTPVTGVNWYAMQAATVGDNGLRTADVYVVRIPAGNAPPGYQAPDSYDGTGWTLQTGDVLVRGIVADEIAKATDVTGKYADCCTVTGVRDNRRGSPAMQHWRVEGK